MIRDAEGETSGGGGGKHNQKMNTLHGVDNLLDYLRITFSIVYGYIYTPQFIPRVSYFILNALETFIIPYVSYFILNALETFTIRL